MRGTGEPSKAFEDRAGDYFQTTGNPNTGSTHRSGPCAHPTPEQGQELARPCPPTEVPEHRALGFQRKLPNPTPQGEEKAWSAAVLPTPWVGCVPPEPNPWEDPKSHFSAFTP